MIRILEARGAAIKDSITVQVKRDLGVYDLILKKAQLKAQLDEVDSILSAKTRNTYVEVNGEKVWTTPIDAEVDRRMKEENRALEEAKAYKESILREIRLSIGTPEIRAMFAKLTPDVKKMLNDVRRLPVLRVRPLSEKDKTVLHG